MRTRSILACLLFAAAAGCGKSKSQAPAATTTPLPEPQVSEQMAEPTTGAEETASTWCPTEVAGTTVTVEDTDSGAALVFRTEGDVVEVRRRVVAMADATNAQQEEMREEEMRQQEMRQQEMEQGEMGAEPGTDPIAPPEPDVGEAPGTGIDEPGTDPTGPGAGTVSPETGTGTEGAGTAMAPAEELEAATTAAVVSTADGARLEITTDADNVEDVQMALRREAAQMNTGSCETPVLTPSPGGADY